MSANLSPQYLEAENQFRSATTAEAKLVALETMLRLIPKHKGTEKMQGDIKKRIAKWKNLEEQSKKKGGKRTDPSHVPREGSAQAAIIGPVNTGKSSLISLMTNLEPNIADYPFTTRVPQPGMMFHHGIPIQLIDTPALDPNVTERWISGLIRNADISVIVLDLARDDLIEQWEAAHAVLEDLKIRPVHPDEEKVYQDDGWVLVPTIYLGNKCAMDEADERLGILHELFDDLPEIHAVSAKTGSGLERFKDLVQHSLKLIRVFSKPPGKEPDLSKPFVVKEGATVSELAILVHKELAQRMKFARVWGESVYDGQRVAMDYELNDGDVIELND